MYAEPTTVTSAGVSLRVVHEQTARIGIEPEVVVRVARDADLVHRRVEVEADPVALERGRRGLERWAFGDGNRRPRVDPVDDAVAAECVQVTGRRAKVDPLQRDAGCEAGDRLRAREPRRVLAEAEQISRIVGGEEQPGLLADGETGVPAAVAAKRDEREEQCRDEAGDDVACEDVHGVSLLRVWMTHALSHPSSRTVQPR